MSKNEILTLCIAGYAAVIATFVLGWDAYKWLDSGPKVRLTSSTGMKIVGGYQVDSNKYVSVVAVNLGDRTTTITNLGFEYYGSWFKAHIRRNNADQAFIVTTPSQNQMIPYRFEAGDQWVGLALQDDAIVQMIRDGYLFVVLYHSHGGRGVRRKLNAKELTI